MSDSADLELTSKEFALSNGKLRVTVERLPMACKIDLVTNLDVRPRSVRSMHSLLPHQRPLPRLQGCILHWGCTADMHGRGWAVAPPCMHPAGTVVIDKSAAQTPFAADGEGSFRIRLNLDAVAASVTSPFALVFVIKRGANEWLKDGRSDFFIQLLRPPASALEVRRKRPSQPSDRCVREHAAPAPTASNSPHTTEHPHAAEYDPRTAHLRSACRPPGVFASAMSTSPSPAMRQIS